jgi:hypothetical protein
VRVTFGSALAASFTDASPAAALDFVTADAVLDDDAVLPELQPTSMEALNKADSAIKQYFFMISPLLKICIVFCKVDYVRFALLRRLYNSKRFLSCQPVY